LTFSPRHTLTTGLSYRFPLPPEVGDVSAGVTYTFTSSQLSSSTDPSIDGSPYGELGARQLVNLNLGWKAIFGSPFDASFFMTNALNEKYYSYVAGLYSSAGQEFGVAGEPKMWGARVKYNFY
jgi:iron complex outermembrane receptor protein